MSGRVEQLAVAALRRQLELRGRRRAVRRRVRLDGACARSRVRHERRPHNHWPAVFELVGKRVAQVQHRCIGRVQSDRSVAQRPFGPRAHGVRRDALLLDLPVESLQLQERHLERVAQLGAVFRESERLDWVQRVRIGEAREYLYDVLRDALEVCE